MKRIRACAAGAASALLLISGCAAGGDDDATDDATAAMGGTLRVGLYAEPNTLDPAMQPLKAAYQVLLSVCEGLYTVDADMAPVPQLATELPEISDDGLTVTVPLRTDAYFNDGDPFNAEAAKSAIERSIEVEGSSVAEDFAALSEIEAPDEETLVLHLDWADARIVNSLASFAGMIPSPQALEEQGEDYGTNPVCVAPFQLESWDPGVALELAKSDHYYDAEEVPLDGVEYVIISDGNVRMVNLQSGDLDVALGIIPEDAVSLEEAADVDVLTQTGIGWTALQVNMANQDGIGEDPVPLDTPLAESPELRQALDLAIDRQAIVEAISHGMNHPSCSPLSPSSPFFDDPDCPERDLEAARELVEDSGYDTPVEFELTTISGSGPSRVDEMIQAMVAEAGFEMTISGHDTGTWLQRYIDGDYEAITMDFSGLPDPDANIGRFFSEDGYYNGTQMFTEDSEELMQESITALDDAERRDVYVDLLEELRSWNSTLFLYNPAEIMAASDGVTGYEWTTGGEILLTGTGFVDAE